jgi:hypothetical protein
LVGRWYRKINLALEKRAVNPEDWAGEQAAVEQEGLAGHEGGGVGAHPMM